MEQYPEKQLLILCILRFVHFFKKYFLSFFAGIWGVGLATHNSNLNSAPGGNDAESWVFCFDGVLRHNKKELQGVTKRATEGDIIVSVWFINISFRRTGKKYLNWINTWFKSQGISFDHIELNFYINGVSLDAPITGIRGTVFPAIYGKRM